MAERIASGTFTGGMTDHFRVEVEVWRNEDSNQYEVKGVIETTELVLTEIHIIKPTRDEAIQAMANLLKGE